jgi:hypothetical protein
MTTDTTTLTWGDLTRLEPRLGTLAEGVIRGAETMTAIMVRGALVCLVGRCADHPRRDPARRTSWRMTT